MGQGNKLFENKYKGLTKEEVNELYEKKVKDHKLNKGKNSHPLL